MLLDTSGDGFRLTGARGGVRFDLDGDGAREGLAWTAADSDGVIDGRDAIFASLRLWRDSNHDGVSQPGELHALPALGLTRLHLDYKESKRTDEFGNRFRYRAKADDARGSKVNRWAWDVFLLRAP